MVPQLKKVYLAGPITGLSYDDAANGWRKEFASLLPEHIEPYSPMRAKSFLKSEAGMLIMKGDAEALRRMPAMATPRGILVRDFNDVKTADAIVACFLNVKEKASIGTAWEIGAAYALQKPTIVIIEPSGNVHDHVFITENAYRTASLEEAALLLTQLLTPGI